MALEKTSECLDVCIIVVLLLPKSLRLCHHLLFRVSISWDCWKLTWRLTRARCGTAHIVERSSPQNISWKSTEDSTQARSWQKYLIRILFDGSYLKGETPYSCNLCGKTFAFQQSFHKHMLYHTDEKPYTCTWKDCGKAFKELSTLQNHERIHSGERPFVCETCNKSFRQRVSYLVHRRWVLYNNFEVKDNRYLDEFSWNGLTGFTLGCCHTLVLPVARNSDTRSEKLFDWSIVIRFMWAGDPEDPPV